MSRVAALLLLGSALAAMAATSHGEEFDFDQSIARTLATHCLDCHNSSDAQGKLDLSRRATAFRGGETGPAIVAGDLAKSLLWRRVEAGDMPPESELPDADKATLKRWIAAGAAWGTDPIDRFQFSTDKRAGYDWWSLQPLRTIDPPVAAKDSWSKTDLDRFVVAKLRRANLRPSPPAEPRTLVRRLYFDLIGLPPPIEVVQQFEQNPTEEAWMDLIDALLESPHYGERWAQHWLDVARFGETEGYEYNVPRNEAWHYRDWVIRALNNDLPYDEFVRMQIAGDLLKPHHIEGAAAVGFLVAGVHNTVLGKSDAMKRASRHEELEEIAGTTAQALLGLTVNCSRCHDHKFDPISTEEYYQFIAALDGVTHGTRSIVSAEQRKQLDGRKSAVISQLVGLVTKRGGRLSKSANALQTTAAVAANTKGEIYTVSLEISPTVWGIKSQATNEYDGIIVRLVRTDGTAVAERFLQPDSWLETGQRQRFKPFRFQYTGDGSGDVQLWVGSNPATGRFGGAIDNLVVRDATGQALFEETFDQFHQQTNKGVQADTKLTVFWGLGSDRWQRSGINSLHAVEYEPGNLAAQIFSGWQDIKIEPATDEERGLLTELEEIEQRLATHPVFSVVPRQPGVMRILHRGDAATLGEEVRPAGLRAVSKVASDWRLNKDASDQARRQALADWITHRDNGPFHRVIVNRIWHYHFGRGIVETPNDLGFNGARPSHPHLLEWLAVWFRDHDYSLKELHRLLTSSATYRQRSTVSNDPSSKRAGKIDRDNRLLWRQHPRRLDAESLRDSLLSFAGALNTQQFGPGYRDVKIETVGSAHYYRAIDPVGDAFNRRTIYRWRARGERSSLLETFDCPDPSATTPSRNRTTTPAQTLSHWNHSLVVRMSKRLASRIESEAPAAATADRVRQAWRIVLMRTPAEDELAPAVALVEKHGLPLLCRVLFNCSEAIVID